MSEAPGSNATTQSASEWAAFGASRLSFLDGVLASTSSTGALDDARTKLEHEIEAVFATYTAMQKRRNSLLPISRLHPEILAHIFSFLAADEGEIPRQRFNSNYQGRYYQGQRSERNPYITLGWIRVTHVCRMWRDVALDNPALWGIDISSLPSCTEERMRRSKQAPIDIQYRGSMVYGRAPTYGDQVKSLLSSLLSALDHTRTLSIMGLNYQDLGELSHHLLLAAPLLESFTCACYPVIGLPEKQSLGTLPQNLFDERALRLRQLSLTNVLIPLDTSFLCNIVDLNFSHFPQSNVAPEFTRDQLLALLDRFPRLRSLELYYVDPLNSSSSSWVSPPADARERISFPSLRKLKINGNVPDCIWLTQRLSIPPSATVLLDTLSSHECSIDHVSSLIPFIAPHSHGSGSIGAIVCFTLRMSTAALRFEGWRTCPQELFSLPSASHPVVEKSSDPDVCIDFKGLDFTVPQFNRIIREVVESFDVDNVTALTVTALSTPCLDGTSFQLDWRRFFSRLTAVEQVAASGVVVSSLISDLHVNPFWVARDGPEADPGEWLFPNLRRLKVAQTNFWNYLEDVDLELSYALSEMLQEARDCPATNIDELLIQDCEIDQSTVNDLEPLVPKLSWDGHSAHLPILPDDEDEDEMEDEYDEEEMYDYHMEEEVWDDDDPNYFDEDPDIDLHDVFVSLGMH